MDWVANMSNPSGLALASNRPAKLAERVAEALKRDISAIGWPVGQVFGSEGQLMERYGIGRATLREAIRQLERHGVANMRRGSGGGLVISRPARDSAALALATYLELIDVSFGELYEARALIESQAVLLAAERLDEPDIPRARALIELLGQEQPGCFNAELRLLADVRDFICRVSGNAAISLILEALQCVTVSGRTPRDAHARARVQTVFGQVRRLKIELLEALIGGDGLRARERIQDKLRLTRELIIELRGGLSHGPTSAMTELAAAPDFAFSRVYDKSAHRLAVVIARNISASGLGSGARIGAEPDLQARHGVSRAVLREAVRTLELHAIVRSRRGPGGGLLVATPDPSYTVRLAVEYLGQTQPLSQHFHAVWKNLQLAVAGLAAERLDAAGRQRLQALLDSLQRAGEAERLQRSGELDLCLAELSGNRALALFVRLLGALAESYPSGAVAQWILQHLGEHQARLGAAVLAGDPSLARRRMLDQLRLIETGFGLAED
jgi:DNA-binding FadR family transcriptional regulator